MQKQVAVLGLRKAVEELEALLKHPGWEVLRERALQDRHSPTGAVEFHSTLRRFQADKDRELNSNNLAGARYWQGRIDQLLEDIEGKLIEQTIRELAEEK